MLVKESIRTLSRIDIFLTPMIRQFLLIMTFFPIFLKGSFLDIDMDENYFDCSVSLHTIYHIDKDIQENAVRKLLYVTKPGQPVIIIYSNPRTLISLPVRLLRMTKILQIIGITSNTDSELYFYQHPNEWWQRFNDVSNIAIYPWRSFAANFTKNFVPNNKFGEKLFRILFNLEEAFPELFVKYFQYNMVVLRKK